MYEGKILLRNKGGAQSKRLLAEMILKNMTDENEIILTSTVLKCGSFSLLTIFPRSR